MRRFTQHVNYLRYHFNADILLELEGKYPQLEFRLKTPTTALNENNSCVRRKRG